MDRIPCKKCLLSDTGGQMYRDRIEKLLEMMDKDRKAEKALYEKRLSVCRSCEKLSGEEMTAGTCLACGCYVELRAAVRTNRCPQRYW